MSQKLADLQRQYMRARKSGELEAVAAKALTYCEWLELQLDRRDNPSDPPPKEAA
jgi:hypothetical protein